MLNPLEHSELSQNPSPLSTSLRRTTLSQIGFCGRPARARTRMYQP